MASATQELELFRKRERTLILDNRKLRGIVKTGQDAVHEEQQLVKSLQERLGEMHQVILSANDLASLLGN